MTQTPPRQITDRDGRVHQFPPPLRGVYDVVEGRLQTRSLEAHIVDHCNLTCAECCSLSPLLPRWFASPEGLARDLALASSILAPKVFKLVGGEPLMHPQIAEMVRVARRSGVAPKVSLTTNGFLIPRMGEDFWEALDAMTISLYPAPELPRATLERAEEMASRFGVSLNWKHQDQFVAMTREVRHPDEDETAAIYARCWLRERCHMIRDGVFTTCTRPPHFQSYYGESLDFSGDGFRLEGEGDRLQALRAYLHREKPLEACGLCMGGDAEMSAHRLLSRAEIKALKVLGSRPVA